MDDLLACPFCGCAAAKIQTQSLVSCSNCAAIACSSAEWNMRVASARAVALEDALRAVLPMAKGYAASNRVGRNDEICREAEQLL